MERDENHPRPQLTRPGWTDLSGPWQFNYDDEDVGLNQGWYIKPVDFQKEIIVPFPPESRASGIGDTSMHPIVWYKRVFQPPEVQAEQRLLLHFGAVDYSATVWVSGQLVARHEGGNTPFEADITSNLDESAGASQTIVVRVEDQPTDLTQPRGKQFWEKTPKRIWYHRTTGIWQPVWLEVVGSKFITELRWTPDLERGYLGLHVKLNKKSEQPLTLTVNLSLRGHRLAQDTYTMERSETRREIALESSDITMNRERILWSPRYPNLIDAQIILQEGDKVLDEVQSYAGLRSVGFSNGRFLLNGRPYYLRMVLEQGYWPESLLAAPSNEALRREVEFTKTLGFNGVRIHQKVEDPRYLYWCDRLGLLVWGEMANAYVFNAEAVEKLAREWLEVIRRDYNHPCIVTWVPLNESWGVPSLETDKAQQHYVQGLYHLTKALDPTRPVIGNDGWEHIASDVWGIHDYALEGDTIRERYGTPEALERTLHNIQPHYRTIVLPLAHHQGEPVMLTEFGGISYAPGKNESWWGYGTVPDDGAFMNKYQDIMSAVLDCSTIVGFCYTQLTDTEQETNGLLRADRSPKLDPAAIRKITSQPTKSMPGEVINILQLASEVTTFQEGGS